MIKKMFEILDSRNAALFVLIFITVSILILQNNQAGFDVGHHGFLSSHGATLAKNLSGSHNFAMFESVFINSREEVSYNSYSRFPVTAFLVIKLFMDIFSPDLSMEIIIARQVMNLFFIGSILFVFLSMYELTKSHITALAVTLFSFSSFYLQYYNDMIFNDTPTLFGFVMTFHGIVLYHRYRRKKQLFVKAAVGLCLGWHVFSMLLGYILISTIADFYRNRSILRILKSDEVKLGFFSLAVGFLMLGFNFANEASMTGKSITEINSFQSARSRIGQNDTFQKQYDEYLDWGRFTKDQLHRIGAMSIPYMFKQSGDFQIAGAIILVLSVLGCFFAADKLLLFTMLVSGFLWAYPMRGYTFSHDYQSIYYVGIPIVFYYMILNFLKTRASLSLPFLLLLSIGAFLSTNVTFNQSKAIAAQKVNPVTADFQNIINQTQSGNIFYIDGVMSEIAYGYHAVEFYLSGNYFTQDKDFAEYIVSKNRNYSQLLLTPHNSEIFLFQGNPYFARAFTKRGVDSYRKGRYPEAIQDFFSALEKDPGFVDAYVNRGIARKKMADFRGAITDYNQAILIDPDNIDALNNLSWLLSTCIEPGLRDGERALSLAQRVVDLNPGAFALDTLAAAHAELKEFDTAVKIQEEAIRIADNLGLIAISMELQKHLLTYQKKKAWRE